MLDQESRVKSQLSPFFRFCDEMHFEIKFSSKLEFGVHTTGWDRGAFHGSHITGNFVHQSDYLGRSPICK